MQARVAVALASLLNAAAVAQPTHSASQIVPRPARLNAAIRGAPFSAERHRIRTRMQDDGTMITETWPVQKLYRDAEGRTRTERPLMTGPNAPEFPRIVELVDPSAGVKYVLEPRRKLAHRFADLMVASPPPDALAAGESLGVWTMQGLRAEGLRRTIRIPAAPQDGDAPMTIVTETWTAPQLHVVLREKLTDPRYGESIDDLTGLNTVPPDPALFQVPADFKVIDEPDDFSIAFPVRSPITLPEIVSRFPAVYTETAKRVGVQGTVYLSLTVDETGRPQGIRVEHSLDPGLDQEAIKAVRQWRFKPAEQDGHPVRLPVHVEVSFSLSDDR